MTGGPTFTRQRSHRRSRRVAAVVALAASIVAAGTLAWLLVGRTGPTPEDAANRFLAAWSRGDDRGAAAQTSDPTAAAASLEANRKGLDGAALRARLLDVREDGAARARTELAWEVPGIGRFAYRSRVTLDEREDGWVVVWSEGVVHPRLEDATQRLGTTRSPARRGDILDRDGEAIVSLRSVHRVGLARDKVEDVGASVAALADVVDIDERAFTRAVRGAGRQQFVEAITLREADYERIEDALEDVPGGLAVHDRLPLAESRGFAGALLGSVGPATAEQLATLRDLTRSVVTDGTGTALASLPGDVHGKSGTAEYGGGDPPPTHAWFIAYRDDVAIAVLVENGRSGGSVAAPIAARFFEALG